MESLSLIAPVIKRMEHGGMELILHLYSAWLEVLEIFNAWKTYDRLITGSVMFECKYLIAC